MSTVKLREQEFKKTKTVAQEIAYCAGKPLAASLGPNALMYFSSSVLEFPWVTGSGVAALRAL